VDAAASPWSAKAPSSGIINLCVAEDKLSADMMSEKLWAVADKVPAPELAYTNMKGTEALRGALAETYGRLLAPSVVFEPRHIAVAAGAGAILEHLAFALAAPGDSVLIPAPWYAAFRNDLGVRAGVRAVAVAEPGGALLPSVASLSAAAERCTAEGAQPRALLLVNPGNPTGLVIPPPLLRELLSWALGAGLHCIVDEVYAFSVFRPEAGPPFVSAAELAWGQAAAGLPGAAQRLHIVLGFSKDFAASGLRCGALYSRCEPLHAALDNCAYFTAVSTHTQRALAMLLSDDWWTDSFLAERRARLRRAHDALCVGLREAAVPYTDSGAGMFVWLDCRKLLPRGAEGAAAGWGEERDFWAALFSCEGGRGGVLLTPGSDCAAPEPGWFRACFAAADPESLPLVGPRIRAVATALGAAAPSEYCTTQ